MTAEMLSEAAGACGAVSAGRASVTAKVAFEGWATDAAFRALYAAYGSRAPNGRRAVEALA